MCSSDRKQASLFGHATVNGMGSHEYRIDLTDNGEPGTNDMYGILLPDVAYVPGRERSEEVTYRSGSVNSEGTQSRPLSLGAAMSHVAVIGAIRCIRHETHHFRRCPYPGNVVAIRATIGPPFRCVGLALVGHQVADLERSIKFFEAIDFKVVEGPGAWTVDKELNKLGNTPGAESRTATMRVQSSVSDIPFTLVLRQYRGMRQDWSKLNSWDLLASHIDLTVDGSVSTLLDKLEALNMLKMPEVQGLPNPRQQQGFRRFAFIQDPDGLTIEYFSKPIPKPGDPPAAPRVSNSSATPAKHRSSGQTGRLQSLRRQCHRSRESPGFLCEGPGRRLSALREYRCKPDHAKRLVPTGDHQQQPAHRAGLFCRQ